MSKRVPRRLTFWAAVGVTSIVAPVVFNVAVDRLEESGIAPGGLVAIRDYITRRNG